MNSRFLKILLSATLLLGGMSFFKLTVRGGELDHIAFKAIHRRDLTLVESLLRQGTPPELHTSSGTTLLMVAALHGNADIVELLLRHGADPNAENDIGVTPLIWGAGDVEKVRLLLKAGGDPNAKSKSGNTPLIVAAAYPDSSASITLLLEHGADIHAKNGKGFTALFHTASRGNLAATKLLVTAGADVNAPKDRKKNRKAVLEAADNGHFHIVAYLEEKGADINVSDGDFSGHTLNKALMRQDPEIARYLIEHGADLNFRSPVGGTPPMVWSAYQDDDDYSIARMMIERGVDVNAANDRGETALTWAEKRGQHELVRLLKKAGANQAGSDGKKKVIPNRNVRLSADNQDPLIRHSVSRSLDLMFKSSDSFLKNRSSCTSCHHQDLLGVAAALARGRGLKVSNDSMAAINETQIQSWSKSLNNYYQMNRPNP
ncbi:MAG TPA: hypothetical protein EYG38_06630, partial [Verrucomicrobia bacterium]|nr:hypothetical protein [Verrucomicrobiota bacterium]